MPRSALFVPGFGAGPDCPLAVAFQDEAASHGIVAFSPTLIEAREGYTIVPPLEVQSENEELQEGLGSDLIIAWSAGHLAVYMAINATIIPPGQKIVLLNPSLRQPTAFINKDGFGRTSDQISEAERELVGKDYDGIAKILPGPTEKNPLIVVTGGYLTEISLETFQPAEFAAQLLNLYAAGQGNRARIIKSATDARVGKQLAEFAEMRRSLENDALVCVDTLDRGSHFLVGQESAIMRDILSGRLFARVPQVTWGRELAEATGHQDPRQLVGASNQPV